MTLSIKCPVRLNQLLAKVWDLHRKRELNYWNKVIQRAAKFAAEEPELASVRVSGFGYRISFDEKGEHVPDPLAEIYSESKPTPKIIQQARDLMEDVKGIAEGRFQPVLKWNGDEVILDFFLDQYGPIAIKINKAVEYRKRVEEEGLGEKIWEYVAKEIAQATDPQRQLNPHALFRYAEQIWDGDMTYSNDASFEINRLDSSGFTDRLYGELLEKYPDELREISLLEEAEPDVNGLPQQLAQAVKPVLGGLKEISRSLGGIEQQNKQLAEDTTAIREQTRKTTSVLGKLLIINENDKHQPPLDESVDDRATAELVIHPDWSIVKIAKIVGCHPKTLSNKERCPKFNAARQAYLSGNPPPRGYKTRDGNIEAFDKE
jgi:hypothetical protein